MSKRAAVETADDGYICTYTGQWIRPLDPDPNAIHVIDIAHALSNQCRFTGHVKKFYSVAQHCILAADLVPDEYKLETLLHDASEAYLSDIARPIKNWKEFGAAYHEAESRLEQAVAERFDLPYPMSAEVKKADNLMLWAEMRDLMPNDPPEGVDMYEDKVIPWDSKMARIHYLDLFDLYSGVSPLYEVGG